ncbi:thioredoxin family protein [Pedobacter sp. BAL39]|uniref:TlpA disulfide reductase family protein n=1 Tax=Pedobacter sp. BAL39 TaxID=391596 RepID=UPI000155998A|nr:TlpA disulfide reductase family protein [Pedobacter sp. BAL39]EDM38631.1 thioredoxin family protein [Pedobacter sp. BAL39]
MAKLHHTYKMVIAAALMVTSSALSFKAEEVSVTGKLNGKDGTTIRLSYNYAGRDVMDSVMLKANSFTFRHHFPEPVICTLSNSANAQIKIFVAENTAIQVSGNLEQFVGMKIAHAIQDSIYHQFSNASGILSGNYRKKLKETGGTLKDTTNVVYRSYQQAKDSLLRSFVVEHRSSTAAALAIIDSYVTNANRSRAAISYALLSDKGRKTVYARRIKQFIDTEKSIAPGKTAPDFVLLDADGKEVRLSDYRGKYVLLDFWASWCPPCRAEHPLLKKINQQLGDKMVFLGLSMDASSSAWKQAVAVDGLTWQQVNDPRSTNGSVADSYGVKSLPFNCIVDPQGKIVATKLRGQQLTSFLSELFRMSLSE